MRVKSLAYSRRGRGGGGGGELHDAIESAVAEYSTKLWELNRAIWSHPELGYDETYAHTKICEFFEGLNTTTTNSPKFKITRHAHNFPTSMEISSSSSSSTTNEGRLIIFNAEYDALPGIGHACGHNLICSASTAAFLATAQALQKHANGVPWRVRLLGTPAEEGGGGKCVLIRRGAYEGADAVLMVHPRSEGGGGGGVDGFCWAPSLACMTVGVTYKGVAAHASSAPWQGVNALDAAVTAYVSISALRQQLHPSQRVCGIITNGGQKSNIIPELTKSEYTIRAETQKELETLKSRVKKCFWAASASTGCQDPEYEESEPFLDTLPNPTLGNTFKDAMSTFGKNFVYDLPDASKASTDMGNVTHVRPGFQGVFFIDTGPEHPPNHSAGFAQGAGTRDSFERAMACAKGLAGVACRVLLDEVVARRVMEDFEKEVGKAGE